MFTVRRKIRRKKRVKTNVMFFESLSWYIRTDIMTILIKFLYKLFVRQFQTFYLFCVYYILNGFFLLIFIRLTKNADYF